jgi:N-acetylglucosamine-6-phosphate deacetylase
VKEIIADKILISNNYLKCDFQIREYQYKIVIADTLRHYCIERYLCVA